VRARAALFHHLQAFFETELRGLFRYDDVTPHVARPVEKVPGKRRQAFGKVREIVDAGFGGYTVTLESSHEAPPLGRVTLKARGAEIASGPIDRSTFELLGSKIREREHQQEREQL
jgi:hypothetical protein